MDFKKFKAIREAYSYLLPQWQKEYEETGDMRQDPYFMNWEFTPIENSVWSDIRSRGLPFFPQIPVLNFFLDFGCPFLKIGIECDGKAWHDSELDKVRDAKLFAEGWMIFRIEGHECMRVIDAWPEYREEDDEAAIRKYFMATSEGVLTAIWNKYFDDEPSDKNSHLIDATLFEHMSTPPTNPKRLQIKKTNGPFLVGELLDGYIEQLMLKTMAAA